MCKQKHVTLFERYKNNLEKKLSTHFDQNRRPLLGYPSNQKGMEKLSEIYGVLSKYPVPNNIGNPFDPDKGHYQDHSLHTEKQLLIKLLQTWGGNGTGYCTQGGTEGNFAGLSLGMSRFGGKTTKENSKSDCVLLYSDSAHYSVPKFVNISKAKNKVLHTNKNGEIDYLHFDQCIKESNGSPLVILATLGTTVKGAIDNLDQLWMILKRYEYTHKNVHIHLDAAFFGGYWGLDKSMPKYTLGKDFHSLSVSSLKWFGGVIGGYFAQANNIPPLQFESVEYLAGMNDHTISGSRNGFISVIWSARLLQFDWMQEFEYCVKLRDYLIKRLTDRGIEAWCNPYSLIVVFPMKSDEIIYRHFQLASEFNQHINQHISHVVILPHVTLESLDALVDAVSS